MEDKRPNVRVMQHELFGSLQVIRKQTRIRIPAVFVENLHLRHFAF